MEHPAVEGVASTSSLAPPTQHLAHSTSSLYNNSYSISNGSFDRDPFTMSTPTPAARLNSTQKNLGPTPFSRMLLAAADDTPMEYQRIFAKFAAYVARAEEAGTPAEEVDPASALQGVEPTPGLVEWGERTCAELEDTKRRREAHIQAMYDQLEALWRRLGVSEDDMDSFVEHHQGSTLSSIKAYEEELERMLELKRERMGTFVENARTEIRKLWSELWVGEEEHERAMFEEGAMVDAEYTEELLSVHEEEIRRLKEEKRAKVRLFLVRQSNDKMLIENFRHPYYPLSRSTLISVMKSESLPQLPLTNLVFSVVDQEILEGS
jgi:Ase1/PRC1/MAP65 family protein